MVVGCKVLLSVGYIRKHVLGNRLPYINPMSDSTLVQWLRINYTRLPAVTRNEQERLGSGR